MYVSSYVVHASYSYKEIGLLCVDLRIPVLHNEVVDHNQPFHNALLSNLFSGDPFSEFLSKYERAIIIPFNSITLINTDRMVEVDIVTSYLSGKDAFCY